jgi:polygalacturonase
MFDRCRLLAATLLFMSIAAFGEVQTNSFWRDVKSFGAVGNGDTLDTSAIQSAITACPSGGVVWLHHGTFRSGTVYLKSNMTLFIDPTATLLGSSSVSHYHDQHPPLVNSQTHNCVKALVYAEGCSNITITGGGTINGNGRRHFSSGLEATRPISIWTALCNHVKIKNIAVLDAAMWSVVNMQSDYLTISNVTINDHGLGRNRDGCDVVDCWHVLISNCAIDSGDDAICLKTGNPRGINDLMVKNCKITKSQSNGIKFGTASKGPFTHITFQDCTMSKTSHSAMAIESVDGGAISDVTFQRIHFTSCQNGIFIVLGARRSSESAGSIRGIIFRDITGTAMTDTRGCPISGCIGHNLENILFDHVNITFAGGLNQIPSDPPEYAGQYPENTKWGNLPAYGYYIRHTSDVTFNHCQASAASPDVRPWIATNDVSNFRIIASP